jgi:hypothetical protein
METPMRLPTTRPSIANKTPFDPSGHATSVRLARGASGLWAGAAIGFSKRGAWVQAVRR